jgi:hypothetical protein
MFKHKLWWETKGLSCRVKAPIVVKAVPYVAVVLIVGYSLAVALQRDRGFIGFSMGYHHHCTAQSSLPHAVMFVQMGCPRNRAVDSQLSANS